MKTKTKVISGALALLISSPLLTACWGDSSSTTGNAQADGQKQTQTAFQQQSSAVPYPASQLRDSLERRNIRERLLRTNNPNKQQYVYLMTITGEYIGYYVIKGKVSSTQSAMTTDQLIQPCSQGGDSGSGNCAAVVSAPGDDGSYGENEKGIFFFTTEGVMVTTDMPYIVSDQPLPVEAKRLNSGAQENLSK